MKFIVFREVMCMESTEVEFDSEEELQKAWSAYDKGSATSFPPEDKKCVWVDENTYDEQISYRKDDDVSDCVVLQEFE